MPRHPPFQVNFDAALPQVQGERLAPSEEQRFTGHVTLDENASASSMADFDILDKLGCGVHGQVKRLRHKASRLEAACKRLNILSSASPSISTVERELSVLQGHAQSPHVVAFYGSLTEAKQAVYIFMELMDLGSLLLFKRTPLPVPDNVCLYIAQCMTAGLDYLHTTLNIVHRDVKPSNVLINSAGQVKLCDFSLSKTWTESVAVATTYVGTFLYMAPERIDPRHAHAREPFPGDIWAMGLTVAEIALKRYPLVNDENDLTQLVEYAVISMILQSKPPNMGDRGVTLQAVIHSCLQLNVQERATLNDLRPMVEDGSKDSMLEFLQALRDNGDVGKDVPS
eukprot:TRINITY_DN12453_c0_g9_i1.p1 TRINITY_DN12453_c0_g9~~TRINITY_DN12453_c0_g9_i1.p1  ORF type:complete len:340 (+),score=70.32 TRINITY_DN12453_c0_g9_i1:227-1246(+)